MARRVSAVAGHRLEQSLQAAQQMLAVCSTVSEQQHTPQSSTPIRGGRLANTTRKCRSVQFGLALRDFQRLRKISDQLGWSRAELARRCLLLVISFLEEHYPELQHGDSACLADAPLDVEQLSLWPGLDGLCATPQQAAQPDQTTAASPNVEREHA